MKGQLPMIRPKIIKALIIIGILLFVSLMAYVLLRDLHDWQNNINGFARKYDSYMGMVFSCEKGAFLIGIILGLIPVAIAGILHWTDRYS